MLKAVIESSAGSFEYDQAFGVNKTMVICFLIFAYPYGFSLRNFLNSFRSQ